MKKSIFTLVLIAGSFFGMQSFAQPGQKSHPQQHQPASGKNNIAKQPGWGPVGNDYAEFYYLPEVDCYYDVVKARFVFKSGNSWKYGKNLPSDKKVDLYQTYKVVVNDPKPFEHNNEHKAQFGKERNRHDQQPIRDSRDSKYSVNKNNPQHRRGGQR